MTSSATAATDNKHPPAGRRVRTPTVLQMEEVECGAAALGSVLRYWGRWVPLDEVRGACGVARDGSSARQILRAAEGYGLEGTATRCPAAELPLLPLPLIAYWNERHFLVVEGWGRGKVYLNDPATGPRVVTPAEFARQYSEVALTLRPGSTFRRGGARWGLAGALWGRLGSSQGALLYVVLASLALVVLGLVVPAFTRVFVDDYLIGGLRGLLPPLLAAMTVTAGLVAAFTWLQQEALLRLETRLALTMSSQFLWHVLRLPIAFFQGRYASEMATRVAINSRVAELLAGELATNALNLVLILFYIILMLQYDVALTGLAVLIAVINLLALRYVARRRSDQNGRLLQEQGKLLGTGFNGLLMIETLKANNSESDFFTRWAGSQAQVINAAQELGLATHLLGVVPPLLTALNTAAILVLGGLRVINSELTLGTLVAFQVLMLAFLTPVNGLVMLGSKFQEAVGDMARLDDVLAHAPDPLADPTPAAAPTARPTGAVELRGLTFGYSPLDPPLIHNLDLLLQPGTRVALVGGSGSGKSTVARLVAGLYQPWEGAILFDGQARADLPRPFITNTLALVDQDIYLFEGTVAENLTLWDATIPEAQVVQAAKDAAIHDEIVERPGGYEALVEEGGRNFSGGQRQRLELARALAGNPRILVLDEATSALDPITEKIIDDNLRRRGCTCLIVAHRLSTIRDVDEILVLAGGAVVQRGTHEQLRRQRGLYMDLMQAEDGKSSKARSASVLDSLSL